MNIKEQISRVCSGSPFPSECTHMGIYDVHKRYSYNSFIKRKREGHRERENKKYWVTPLSLLTIRPALSVDLVRKVPILSPD